MSITQPCFYNDQVIGIVGIDLHMGDLVEDITYHQQDRSSYSFLINTEGKLNEYYLLPVRCLAIVHPTRFDTSLAWFDTRCNTGP